MAGNRERNSGGNTAYNDGEVVDFPEEQQKQTQKINFTAKYDNNKWSVGGFYETGGIRQLRIPRYPGQLITSSAYKAVSPGISICSRGHRFLH